MTLLMSNWHCLFSSAGLCRTLIGILFSRRRLEGKIMHTERMRPPRPPGQSWNRETMKPCCRSLLVSCAPKELKSPRQSLRGKSFLTVATGPRCKRPQTQPPAPSYIHGDGQLLLPCLAHLRLGPQGVGPLTLPCLACHRLGPQGVGQLLSPALACQLEVRQGGVQLLPPQG